MPAIVGTICDYLMLAAARGDASDWGVRYAFLPFLYNEFSAVLRQANRWV